MAEDVMEKEAQAKNDAQKPRRKKKEREFRRVKNVPPMSAMIPFIMVNRVGSQTTRRMWRS